MARAENDQSASKQRGRKAQPRRWHSILSRTILAALIMATPTSVWAAWAPDQPIRFIVMAGKGGGADKAVRFLSKLIKSYRPDAPAIDIVNIPGRSGADALAEIKKLSGNPYTLMFTLNSFYTAPLIHPEIGIDIAKLSPIGRLAKDTFVLWVHSDRTDINTIEDFVAAARKKGKDWVMSGTGTGSEDNLLTDFLNAQYGLTMTYQSRKGGGAVAKDLVEKRADSTVNNPSEQNKYAAAGDTKPIVAITPQRLPQFLKTPTLKETGMNFHYFMQRSVVAPAGIPPEAETYYSDLFREIFEGAEWQGYRTKNSLQGAFISGDELRSFWITEQQKHDRWRMSLELLKP